MKRNIILFLLLSIILISCKKESDTKYEYKRPDVKISEFTDTRDNNVYKCIEVNGQVWMAENFRFKPALNHIYGCFSYHQEPVAVTTGSIKQAITFSGKKFPTELKDEILKLITEGYSSQYILATYESIFPPVFFTNLGDLITPSPFDEDYYNEYGLLYTIGAATRYAPQGWRLPTDEDWSQLEKSFGMPASEIAKLDEWRGDGLARALKEGNDGIGFNAKYAGARLPIVAGGYGSHFFNKGANAYYWSSTPIKVDTVNYAITRALFNKKDAILRGTSMTANVAYSVRYIKN